MFRAFAVCAVSLAVQIASAQSVGPTILASTESNPEPAIALNDATNVSACGEHECPASVAADEAVAQPIDPHALLRQKLAELNCLQGEIDALRAATGTPQQVLVKIKVLEVWRTKLRKMGADFSGKPANEQVDALLSYSGKPGDTQFLGRSETVDELVNWLRQNNIAKVLAEPTIVTTSGRPASFNVGGEVPLPAAPGSSQAVGFKPFGTQVDVLAIAKGENRVRLELRARVSELDELRSNEIAGKRVPAFKVRQVDSSCDMEFGQTGALSGTVERRVEALKIGDQVVNTEHEIELVFLVTPESATAAGANVHAENGSRPPYHTATPTSEVDPAERSLRVTKPYAPRY
jgi:hypothetical protein